MSSETSEAPKLPENPAVTRGAIVQAALLFFAGFVLSAAFLHLLVGNTLALYGAERSEKLEILKRNDYVYSSAIFGSSHTHQGFDAREFDAGLAGTPLAVRSFNAGIDGGSQVEQRVMALAFLDHLKPPAGAGPCLVMLEVTAPPTFSPQFTSHPRQINILDWRALQLILQFPSDGYKRPNQIHHRLISLTAAFYHAIDMGMLSDRIFRPAYRESSITVETANDQRGAHHVSTNVYAQADITHVLARQHVPPLPVPGHLALGNATLMEDLHRAPNGNRAQLVWVVMPLLGDLSHYHVYPPSEPLSFGEIPILDLGRPDLYPELYDRSLWVDSQHMNEQGSKVFSRILAQQLLAWSRDHPVQRCGG